MEKNTALFMMNAFDSMLFIRVYIYIYILSFSRFNPKSLHSGTVSSNKLVVRLSPSIILITLAN